MSEEITDLIYPANLTNAQRGQLAELMFIRKAASLGFAVAKPWAEGERYDAIVRVQDRLWRVQVKSTLTKACRRPHYRVRTTGSKSHGKVSPSSYSSREIDFFVVYIFEKNAWYVFPATVIEHKTSLALNPDSKRTRFEPYREAWHLMRPAARDLDPGQHPSQTSGDYGEGACASRIAKAGA